MADWNSSAYFNRRGHENGFTWNSKFYLFIIRINDVLRLSDNVSEMLARLILSDKTTKFYDTLVNTAFYGKMMEEFTMFDEEPFVTLLVSLVDSLGMKDEFTDFVVKMFLDENVKVLEQINIFAKLLESEEFQMDDITDLHAFLNTLDSFGLKDLEMTYFTYLYLHDKFGLTDRDPRTAVSDFLIGSADELEKSMDYLIPFNLAIDWARTEIAVMPNAELTEIKMPSVDGSLIADTTYRDRVFSIVAFSEQGLTIPEKEDIKRRITQILDSTKHASKKLTVQSRSVSFDCKYENEAKISEGPSFVKAEIDLRVGPYGYSFFPTEVYGSGLLDNSEGAAPLRVKHTITGPITNPSFTIDGTQYTWKGTVPSGYKLVIDHDNYTCYTIDNFGNKKNVLQNLSGDFMSIPAGSSSALVANSTTKSRMVTEYSTPLLW